MACTTGTAEHVTPTLTIAGNLLSRMHSDGSGTRRPEHRNHCSDAECSCRCMHFNGAPTRTTVTAVTAVIME